MDVKLYDRDRQIEVNLNGVERLYVIPINLSQCEDLKGSILIMHKTNHCEKFRLYKNSYLIEVNNL